MSEFMQIENGDKSFRRCLFAGASIFALLGYAWGMGDSQAETTDEGRPTVWVELGGQAERIDAAQEIYAPPFLGHVQPADLAPIVNAQRPSRYGVGGEGKIIFDPLKTDWILSTTVRYGRSNSSRHLHQQTPLPYLKQIFGTQILPQPANQLYGDGQVNSSESHFILDFQVGKDVGLGLFGAVGKSLINVGVRYAQFSFASDVSIHARPEYRIGAKHTKYLGTRLLYQNYDKFRHSYSASFIADRNSHGVGPSVSWDASLPVAGYEDTPKLTIDWGINAAVLFGRQKVKSHHQTQGHYYKVTGGYILQSPFASSYSRPVVEQDRTKFVTIPNIGAFAGLSLKFSNAKISLGYRGDWFINATDNGIYARKTESVGFYGPFATMSVGLGG